jgi:hypothetical protein
MRKSFLICALAIATVTAAQASDRQVTSATVKGACDGDLQSALGAYGCTICTGKGDRCIDYSCNTNPDNGARLGCWAVSFIATVKRGPSSSWGNILAPGWLSRNVAR